MTLIKPATLESRKAAIVMLLLTGTYLVFELGFNARLLDVVGSTATSDEVENIEHCGRFISGVALTLLVWNTQFKRWFEDVQSAVPFIVRLGISAAICITAMYQFQKVLVDHLTDGSSVETRARAAILVPISHLVRNETFHLTKMDVAPNAYETPEGKTFVATFPLQALAAPNLVTATTKVADQIFRLSVVNARGSVEKAFADYQASEKALRKRYEQDYEPGVRKYDAAIRDIGVTQRKAWMDYRSKLVYKGVFGGIHRIEPSRVPKAKWPSVRLDLREQGIMVDQNWRPDDIAGFNRAVDLKVRNEARSTFERETKGALKSDTGIAPDLSFVQWTQTGPIQAQWKKSLGSPASAHLVPAMSQETYEAQFYEPVVQADIDTLKRERLAPVAQYADGAKLETIGKDSARALIVPPIALTFSLLGAFTHIFKCAMFVAKLVVKVSGLLYLGAFASYLFLVISMPFRVPNDITRQPLVSILAQDTEKALPGYQGKSLNTGSQWVMLMQKYFYPLNEGVRTSLLRGLTYGYEGRGSAAPGTPLQARGQWTAGGATHVDDDVRGSSKAGGHVSQDDLSPARPLGLVDRIREKNLQSAIKD